MAHLVADAFLNYGNTVLYYYKSIVEGMKPNDVLVAINVTDPYSYLVLQLLEQLLATKAHVHLRCLVIGEYLPEFASGDDMRQPYFLHDVYQILAFYPSLKFPSFDRIPKEAKDKDATSRSYLQAARALLSYSSQLESSHDPSVFVSKARVVLEAFWSGNAVHLQAEHSGAADIAETDVAPLLGKNIETLKSLGHYQGAMLATMGEWFWGVDRFQLFVDRLIVSGDVAAGTVLPVPRTIPAVPSNLKFKEADAPHLDVYYSFRSPYSYLSLLQLERLRAKYGIHIHLKPVLPMVKRGLPVPKEKSMYIVKDCKREAMKKDIPFGKIIDPLSNVEKLLGLFMYAASVGKEFAYTHSVSKGTWAEGYDAGNDAHVQFLCERAGLDWSGCRPHLSDESFKSMVETNKNEMNSFSMWGVPSFHLYEAVGGQKKQLFHCWGQDRIQFIDAILADVLVSPSNSKL